MTVELTIFALSFLVMVAAARVLPRALSGIALILHLPEFVVAFVLVAIATSMPELFIGISSSLQGVSALSFGNIFGANLANMTFILGIAAILAKKNPQGRRGLQAKFFLYRGHRFFPSIPRSRRRYFARRRTPSSCRIRNLSCETFPRQALLP